jgi:hypothetical protein
MIKSMQIHVAQIHANLRDLREAANPSMEKDDFRKLSEIREILDTMDFTRIKDDLQKDIDEIHMDPAM